MSETLFYQLDRAGMEDVLPGLLEKTRERGMRAVVRLGSAERMAALDTYLWTYNESNFLAHGTAAEGSPEKQPIYLTTEAENPNNADILFLVDGAWPADWTEKQTQAYKRIVALFDGADAGALSAAREAWKSAKGAGHDVTYWKQSASGKWEKQA